MVDDLAALRQRLLTARRQMVELMSADRDRAVPEPGRLQMVAHIQATLAEVDGVDGEMGDLPATFYDGFDSDTSRRAIRASACGQCRPSATAISCLIQVRMRSAADSA